MPTFLTGPRMDPALARRVERAVSGRRKEAAAAHPAFAAALRRSPRSPARWAMVALAAAGSLGVLGFFQAEEQHELDRRRAVIVDTLAMERFGMAGAGAGALDRARRWVAETAPAEPPRDYVAARLAEPGELDEALARPAVYLRGAREALADPRALEAAASASAKDAFLTCLVDPPGSRSTADLLRKVRGVSFGGALDDDVSANVRPLGEAALARSLVDASWEARAQAAGSRAELDALEREVARAPLARAREAASAEVLVLVVDEDDHAHARVALVDLAGDELLLRVRRPLAEADRSKPAAVLHAAAIASCALAVDLRVAADEPSP